jgi:hypothetical protein
MLFGEVRYKKIDDIIVFSLKSEQGAKKEKK